MAFDYEAEIKADAVLSVADAIRSSCRLAPLTDKQKEQRRIEIEDHQETERWRAEDRRAEKERQQAEAEAVARHETALEQAELNRQKRERMRQEYIARQEQQNRSLDLSIIRNESQAQSQWRTAVQLDLRRQHVQSLYGELEKMLVPPEPPEPTVVYVESEPQDEYFCGVKIPRWR